MTLSELESAWNAGADRMNAWDELGLDEIVAFAQAVGRDAERERLAQIFEAQPQCKGIADAIRSWK